ncbi:hypothetical protein PFDSM3638_02035 [Pyrococcus furiosus DSM 3638]|uniref:Uncharacterized protein n=3 Tax=Pyrococcus furiosus TaxID=2261 RepID=Q8U3P3_PYRFU|nr:MULTISPECIES: hypothetical protein [Pyrococcus]AAL80538.1 hypothetical protein PF0414 [Pyrococcus furiosus DSM 3638]AFN03204.1 hypothetical protein PFC_01155 [Pyrococcus furiosus COM1]MDK2869255.1 hypothetical protein [Pyrococcus sp.]QEK78129.1 hypothetical protein PFDSM3638_02035 [Pyrococcus furiosus DSM 3638]
MWVEVLSYHKYNPPPRPLFRKGSFEVVGKRLVFKLKPLGEIMLNLEFLTKTEGVLLTFYNPPRRGIRFVFPKNFEVLVTVGRNPLVYSIENLIKLAVSVYSSLLDSVPLERGILRIVGDNVAIVTDRGISQVRVEDLEGEIRRRVEEFLGVIEFLKSNNTQ